MLSPEMSEIMPGLIRSKAAVPDLKDCVATFRGFSPLGLQQLSPHHGIVSNVTPSIGVTFDTIMDPIVDAGCFYSACTTRAVERLILNMDRVIKRAKSMFIRLRESYALLALLITQTIKLKN